MTEKGLFIALEGIDGSGTTTQCAALAEIWQSRGHSVLTTREPSQGSIGRLLRAALAGEQEMSEPTLALMFAADRLHHVDMEIEPALAAGHIVISDRYLLSSLAYQSTHLPLEWIIALNRSARRPDLSVLLKVGPETAAQRRQQRGGPEEIFDGMKRQKAVAERYEQVFFRPDVGATAIIDAERGVQAITRDLEKLLEPLVRSANLEK